MDLSLDISGSHIETLTDALNEFTKTETLTGDNKVHCTKCGTKRTATKGLRLATAPSILVCHLKRFAYDACGEQVRLRKKVRFGQRLEIGDFMSKVNKARPPPYDLVAVLVHQGQSCESGHYISYVKNNGEWFLCNDSIVKKVDIATVLDQQAYILMYEVAEMREKSGFPSPCSRPLRSRSGSWRDDSSLPSARGFHFPSLLCGIDENFLTDICCTQSGFGKEPKAPSNYESRFGHQTDDLSSHCEITPESYEPLNRCSSSGRAWTTTQKQPLEYRTRPEWCVSLPVSTLKNLRPCAQGPNSLHETWYLFGQMLDDAINCLYESTSGEVIRVDKKLTTTTAKMTFSIQRGRRNGSQTNDYPGPCVRTRRLNYHGTRAIADQDLRQTRNEN
jgi:hypothetical protein